MDAELKQALADMEGRIYQHVDEWLESFVRRFDERLETVVRRFEERLEIVVRRFDERLENTGTKVLTAFHNWAQTYEVRARGTTTAVREFEERLGFLEERVNRLERSRNGPPKA